MHSDAAGAIRNAVALGEFAKAQELWEEYAAQLRAAILARAATEEMLAEARAAIEWCSLAVKAFRAQGAYNVDRARIAQIYRELPSGAGRLIRTRA